MARAKSVPSFEISGRMCLRSGWLEFLQRSAGYEHSGEVYATHCLGCGNSYKVYQNPYHDQVNCPWVKRIPFDLNLAKKLVRKRKRAVRVFWEKFEAKRREARRKHKKIPHPSEVDDELQKA